MYSLTWLKINDNKNKIILDHKELMCIQVRAKERHLQELEIGGNTCENT